MIPRLATVLAVMLATASASADPLPAPATDSSARPATAPADSPAPVGATPQAPAVSPAPSVSPPPVSPASASGAAPVPEAAPPQLAVVDGLVQRHGLTWELTVTGGVRLWRGEGNQSRWWYGRARAGLLLYSEPTFLTLGIAGQLGPLESSALGVEAEVLDLWQGFWVQTGVWPIDSATGVSIEGALGYTLFGVEYQRRLSGAREGDQAVLFMLHIPIGVIAVAVKKPAGVTYFPTR